MSRRFTKFWLALICTCFLLSATAQQNYYIDAVSGNDANSGTTLSAPWKNISKLNSLTITAGSTINLKAGSVWTSQQLKFNGSGSAVSPIIINRYGTGANPILHGNGLVGQGVVYLYNQQYIEINNLEITNSPNGPIDSDFFVGLYSASGSNPNPLGADRRGVMVVIDGYGTANHIYLKNLNIHHVKGQLGSSSSAVNGAIPKRTGGIYFTVLGTTETSSNNSRFNDVLIDSCNINYCENIGLALDNEWNVYYPGGTEYSNWYSRRFSNVKISNNILHHIGKNAMIVRCTDETGLVEKNVCYETALGTTGNTMFTARAKGTVFQYNEGYYNRATTQTIDPGNIDGSMYDPDFGSIGIIFQYSYSHDNSQGIYWGCNTRSASNNTSGVPDPQDTGCTLRYCVSQNDKGDLVYFNYSSAGNEIYNNVFYISSGLSPNIIHENSGNNHTYNFYNNIIYNLSSATSGADYAFATSGTGVQTKNISNNLFYGNHHLTEPSDPFKLTSNPYFVTPGAGALGINTLDGYKLIDGSSAISSGKIITNNGGKDYFGNSVLSNAVPNRGAYQGSGITSGATNNATTISACDNYLWNGTTYTASGNYLYSYTNSGGYPSVDTLHLTFNTSTNNKYTQTACDSYVWNGTTYTASGTYTYNYTNSNGCASRDTLVLIVNASTRNATTQSAYGSYLWNGTTYTASGNYVYNYTNANGCVSADTLHLTISSSATYNASSTWTCPAGVTSIQVECWGAGGGGGGSTSSSSKYTGGGGAGGNFVKNTSISVTPGNVYTITVGAGGNGGSTTSTTCNGANGGSTSFSGTGVTTLTAAGGNPGLGGYSSLSAGTGGVAATTGNAGYSSTYSYAGGSGTNATWVSSSSGKSGPGGGAAGSNGAGSTTAVGSITAGAAGTGGGTGGAGLTTSGNGNDGVAPGGGGGGGFGSSGTGGKGGNGRLIITYNTIAVPTIVVSTSVTPLVSFTAVYPDSSSTQSFTVSGSNLTGNITLSAPTDFEISTNSVTGFGSTITLTQNNGNVANTVIYVRMKSATSIGNYNESITATSNSATSQNISCAGVVSAPPVPTINVPSAISLSGFYYLVGTGPSVVQSVTISAQNLTDSLDVSTSNANYEISVYPNTGFVSGVSAISLLPTEGAINTTIYIRLKSGLVTGSYNATLTISSIGATNQSISCSGTVTATSIITQQPQDATICSGSNATFVVKSSAPQSLKWQRSTDGTNWVDITATLDAGTVYSGFTSDTLKLTGSNTTLDYYQYRAVYSNAISNVAILTVTSSSVSSLSISGNNSLCVGASTSVTVSASSTTTSSSINPDDFVVPKFSSVTVTSNVAYGAPDGSFHLVDIYRPTGDTTTKRPAVMLLHGGGFRSGNDKTQSYIVSFCTYLAKCGYVAFAPNYNVGGGHTFAQNLAAVKDADLCLNWIRANGATYNYDANSLFVGGGSAGAHLSCNFMFSDNGLNYNGYVVNLNNVIAFADCWGSSPDADRLYAYSSLNTNSMPVLIVHGTSDQTVPVQESITLNNYLVAAGAYVDFWSIPGETHGCPNHIAAISDTMAHFFNRAWKRKGTSTSTSSSVSVSGGTWSSSNTNVVTINATTGILTAISAGTVTITYTLNTCSGVSTATKNITINPLLQYEETVAACDSYSWKGTTYTTSGNKLFTKTNASGCDSTYILHLTINNPTHNVTTQTACDSYSWNGTAYTSSGTYTYVYTNGVSCPSVDTLKLTIKSSTHNVTTQTSCDNYTWNGTTYTSSGTYTFAYTNGVNCPSVDTLKLTIKSSTHNVTAQSSCDSYVWNGTTYISSGTYTFAYTNGVGCPSVDTLKLTIKSSTHNVTTQLSCDSYTWNGITYTSSGTYTYAYTNGVGCPSVDTLKLTIKSSTHNVTTQTSCDNYTWNGTTYTSTGTYTFAYTNGEGCPSVDTLKLTIKSSTHNVTTQTSCDSYTWNGTTYTSSGTYTYAYTNGVSCPSVDTLKLTIKSSTHNVTTQTSCDNYTWNGTTYTSTGTYTFAYTNGEGCPSVDTLKLTIKSSTHNVTTQTACDSYTWNRTTYTTSGTYTYVYTNGVGCPSVDTLKLTIKSSTHNVTTQTSCDSYTWNGTTYTSSGTYTYAYTNGVGCPSVDTLKLTIKSSTHNVTTQTSCDNYTWNGTTYTLSGIYTYAYTNGVGCPSVDTLKLTIKLSTHNVTTQTSCDSYVWNGITYTSSGTYTYTTSNAVGCDSVVTLQLTINSSPVAPTITSLGRCSAGSVTLTANALAGETINWYTSSVGGAAIASGNSYTTPSLSSTTTYYVGTSNTTSGCSSSTRTPVIAEIVTTVPLIPTGSNVTICSGSRATAVVSVGAGETADWYSAATGGILLLSGNTSYTSTTVLTAVTTYYAQSRNIMAGCLSATRKPIAIAINALPATIATVVGAARCGADTATIKATAIASMTADWYADSLRSGSALQSGSITGVNTYTLPSAISSTTTYWAVQRNITTGCTSVASKPVVVVINTVPAEPTVSDKARCGKGSVTFSATAPITPTGNTIAWYATPTTSTTLATTATYATPATVAVTTTYYVASKTTASCYSSRKAVVEVVNDIPVAPSGYGDSTCASRTTGGSVQITVSAIGADGNNIKWYASSTSIPAIGADTTSSTYTGSMTATTTYYAADYNPDTRCISARIPVVAKVLALPAAVAAVTSAARCGTDTASIKATATTGNTINWYSDSLRIGVSIQTGTATGVNTYTLPSAISVTTTYWAAQRVLTNGCLSAASKAVVVKINDIPVAPAVVSSSVARCGTGSAVLTAILPTNPSGTVLWYKTNTDTTKTIIGTAITYTTPATTAITTTFFVGAKITATGCISKLRAAVAVVINDFPAVPTTTGASICGTGLATVSASSITSGAVIDWYTASSGGTIIKQNTSSLDTILTATKTFYALSRVLSTGCMSSTRASAVATVNSLLVTPSTLTGTITNICPIVGTSNGSTFTCGAVTGATSYKWTIPNTAVVDSPALSPYSTKVKVRFVTAGVSDSVFVQAIGAGGCSGAKKVIKLSTTGCATSLIAKKTSLKANSNNEKMELNVFPNPTRSDFNVLIKTEENTSRNATIKIYDIGGNLLITSPIKTNEIVLLKSPLQPGSYIVVATFENSIQKTIFTKF